MACGRGARRPAVPRHLASAAGHRRPGDPLWLAYRQGGAREPGGRIRRLYATENAARRLADDGVALPVTPELVRPDTIAARLGPDAVHQGLLAEADPLPSPDLEELPASGIVLMLDQITDPHNVAHRSRWCSGGGRSSSLERVS